MENPDNNSEIVQLIERLSNRSNAQQQQIADSFDDGLILLNLLLEPTLVNQKSLSYLKDATLSPELLSKFEIYSQKRNQTRFDLQLWTRQQLTNHDHSVEHFTATLWLRSHDSKLEKPQLIPVAIKAYPIISDEREIESLLIFIVDQTLKIQAEAQIRLMETSDAGQFITDAQGLITQPNYAFAAYTGLDPEMLKKITYIDWLKQQVIFRVPFGLVMESLLENGSWSGEVQISSATETQYHAVLSLSMLTDHNRNVEHFVGVLQDITDIHDARNEITRLAYYDNLTGLPNRTLLHNQVEDVISLYSDSKSYSGLILLDLDSFKMINDTLGHAIGDQLLILVSQKLTEIAGQNNLVSRLDGDEFAILVKNINQDPTEALIQILGMAYKVQDSLDDRYTIANRSLHCTVSVGVYLFNEPPKKGHSDELIRYANMALHEAKNLGGNQVFQFEDKLCEIASQRLEMLQALNHSDLDDEFKLYFQAQVDHSGKAIAAETLLRWFHPSLGFVPPADFIPVAEEGRQIIKIGLWVMHKAFVQAKSWNEQYEHIRVSINISPVQFHEQSFVELVIGLVKFTQVNPNYITLELTEGVLIRNTSLALQKIQHLVSLGFHISIDDFGTGYSSLSYLQKLPIHELKIDQSFIQHIPENKDDVAIVDSIIKLAENKNLLIIAEGVETEVQARFLHQNPANILIQGYLYSKPTPASQFEAKFLAPKSCSI
ncbi:MAG: hypothetical protein ISEC1_P0311 [Thiomicrorhabdus sp.]|nr:MAG: hypothetical protein ISEC1_P0311 [Thiomicrorhabdus sp.]